MESGLGGLCDRAWPPGNFETLKETVMSKEMSTGEKGARLDLLIAQAQSLLKDLVERKAALAEAEKPKLKLGHWDLVLDEAGRPHIVIADMERVLQMAGPTFLCTVGVKSQDYRKIGDLQKYFDHIEALSQPLHNFTADVHPYGFDFEDFPGAPILLAGNWHTIKDAEEISMKLQRVIHTAKQAKNS